MYKTSPNACGCGTCICRKCFYWWSGRCPYGGCYDEYRAKLYPYDKAHPNKPPRMGWTDWKNDQAYWCRGGICYPITENRTFFSCPYYTELDRTKTKVRECLFAVVTIYQDKYMQCPIVDSVGCEECYERYKNKRNLTID